VSIPSRVSTSVFVSRSFSLLSSHCLTFAFTLGPSLDLFVSVPLPYFVSLTSIYLFLSCSVSFYISFFVSFSSFRHHNACLPLSLYLPLFLCFTIFFCYPLVPSVPSSLVFLYISLSPLSQTQFLSNYQSVFLSILPFTGNAFFLAVFYVL